MGKAMKKRKKGSTAAAAGRARASARRAEDGDTEQTSSPVTAARHLAAWADDDKQQEHWLTSRGGGLEGLLLSASGGMVFLQDFMPVRVADSVLTVLESLPEEAWELSEQAGDEAAASHSFWSTDVCDVTSLSVLRSIFWQLLPSFRGKPTLPIFSCGRYGQSDFIGRHDDRAHVPINSEKNVFSRTVAAIWYLTRKWSAKDGGCLVDLENEDSAPEVVHVPVYNSFVTFQVPHMHSVTAVTGVKYRYSIFGWWHQEGKLYDLPRAAPSALHRRKVKKKYAPRAKKRKANDRCEAAVRL
mmetsp:Transcript_19981/g.46811  ORF Transcript_19981/g.46811 Transcript_19981/m.46811 type:complete len:299 (+) Transcript_19981:84-980(+)